MSCHCPTLLGSAWDQGFAGQADYGLSVRPTTTTFARVYRDRDRERLRKQIRLQHATVRRTASVPLLTRPRQPQAVPLPGPTSPMAPPSQGAVYLPDELANGTPMEPTADELADAVDAPAPQYGKWLLMGALVLGLGGAAFYAGKRGRKK